MLELVDVENIIPRTGLVDTAELDRRWSKRLVLFHNSQILPLHQQQAEQVLKKEKLDRFTWVMTIITASLLASASRTCLEQVLLDVLSHRCAESDGYEYLIRDLVRNIEAWTSIARTRTLAQAASERWTALAIQGTQLPGLIPDADRAEIVRLLLWLLGGGEGGKHDKTFYTGSSDVCSFAMLLNHLGMDTVHAGKAPADESLLSVVYDTTRLVQGHSGKLVPRGGMRINLTNMEECVSLWPGSSVLNEERRNLFVSAMHATASIKSTPAEYYQTDIILNGEPCAATAFVFEASGRNSSFRGASRAHSFANQYLCAPNRQSLEVLSQSIDRWATPDGSCETVDCFIRFAQSKDVSLLRDVRSEIMADLQVFLLGYQYGLLRQLVDTQSMELAEAFGAWSWNDFNVFALCAPDLPDRIAYIDTHESKSYLPLPRTIDRYPEPKKYNSLDFEEEHQRITFWTRTYILKLVSYFFAGAEPKQFAGISPRTCGVKGKLTVADAALMGQADTAARANQFNLLDVDETVFPSNTRGQLYGGGSGAGSFLAFPKTEAVPITPRKQDTMTEDYTSQVEPKWDADTNACVVSYRRHGRIVHTLDPSSIYHAILRASQMSWKIETQQAAVRFAINGLFTKTAAVLQQPDYQLHTEFYRNQGPIRSTSAGEVIMGRKVEVELFDGGQVPRLFPERTDDLADLMAPVSRSRTTAFVATNGLPRARSCIASVFGRPWSMDASAARQ